MTSYPLLPDLISHYRILKKLGAGGMGEVYLAEDTRLDRTVAVKILSPELATDEDRACRFLREAKVASALNHPHICTVYEVDRSADGQLFMVMEYVEGQSLDAKINGQPMPISEVIALSLQVADALDEAHAKGVVHRDIKPANLMLTPRGQVKVLDFGLAKVNPNKFLDSHSDIATLKQTLPGMVMGTIQYMSPEQAMGRPVDQRSDIFSLGVAMYEMVTGRLPFGGDSASEVIDKISHNQPDAIARFNYTVPIDLERIIRKCLEKEPERRYQSAKELFIDLKNLKRDSESGSVMISRPSPWRSFFERRKLSWLLLPVLLFATALWWYYGNEPRPSETVMQSLAVLPLSNLSSEPSQEYLSDGLTESLINNLSQLPSLQVTARATAFRYKGQDLHPQRVGRELKVDAVMTGKVTQQGEQVIVQIELVRVADGAQIWGERYNRRLSDLLSVQEDMAKEIVQRLRLKLSSEEANRLARRDTESSAAYQLWLKGRYHFLQWTPEGRRKAIELFQQALQEDPAYAPAYAWLSGTYDQMGIREEIARPEARAKARAFASKALELDASLSEAHAALGIAKWRDWDWSGAERDLQHAIELNPQSSDGLDIYATFLLHLGKPEAAFSAARRAQEIDPLSLNIILTVGRALFRLRRYQEAADHFEKALNIYPQDHQSRIQLGWSYLMLRRYDEAIQQANLALSSAPAEATALLVAVESLSGKPADAQRELAKLVQLNGQTNRLADLLALVCAVRGEKDAAFAWLEKVVSAKPEEIGLLIFDPNFEALRGDNRFPKLLQQVGLPS